MPPDFVFPLAAAVQLGVLAWAAAFGIRTRAHPCEVLPLMILTGANVCWMLGLWGRAA